MKKAERALSLFAALVLLVLAGCGTSDGSDGLQAEGKELVFAANGGVSMDPGDGYRGWACIRNGVGETLFRLTDSLEVEPFKAEDYAV